MAAACQMACASRPPMSGGKSRLYTVTAREAPRVAGITFQDEGWPEATAHPIQHRSWPATTAPHTAKFKPGTPTGQVPKE